VNPSESQFLCFPLGEHEVPFRVKQSGNDVVVEQQWYTPSHQTKSEPSTQFPA